MTAEAQAVQQKYAPQQSNAIGAAAPIVGEAIGGGPGALAFTAGKAAMGHATNALAEAARNRLIEGTARGLAATGPAQQSFLGQVQRAYGTNALAKAFSQGGSAAANLLTRSSGNALANAYLPSRQRQ